MKRLKTDGGNVYGRNIYKKNPNCGSGWLVDFSNRLLSRADFMVWLSADYDKTAGRNALPLR
jgi:hypothetical protein